MMDVIEITFNEFKEDIYAKYIRLFPEDEQRDWKKIERTYKDGRNRRAASEKMSTGLFSDPPFRFRFICVSVKQKRNCSNTVSHFGADGRNRTGTVYSTAGF